MFDNILQTNLSFLSEERFANLGGDIKYDISIQLVEILDESADHNSETYIKSLVEMKGKVTRDVDVLEEYEGLAHVYTMEFNSKYGFLIDDDIDFVEE